MTPLIHIGQTNHLCDGDCDSSLSSSHHRRIGCVSFSNYAQLYTVEKWEDYTLEEINACWYTAEEKSRMHESFTKVATRMETGKRPRKNTTYRGLENLSDANALELDKKILACIDAVLDEQERQWYETDSIEWDLFREVSLEVSSPFVSLAYSMAKNDEQEAFKIYNEISQEPRHTTDSDASFSTASTKTSKSTESIHNKTTVTSRSFKKKRKKTRSKTSKSGPAECRSSEISLEASNHSVSDLSASTVTTETSESTTYHKIKSEYTKAAAVVHRPSLSYQKQPETQTKKSKKRHPKVQSSENRNAIGNVLNLLTKAPPSTTTRGCFVMHPAFMSQVNRQYK